MKSYLLLFALASGSLGGVLERNVCNADNCARAVTGTRFAASIQAQHTADCSSFMLQTVTPATSYSTVIVTPTSYSVIGSVVKRTPLPIARSSVLAARQDTNQDSLLLPPSVTLAARQVTQEPSSVPTYATACSGTVRYSSACSCAGITAMTAYAPTPTGTTTIYAPVSIIPVCDPAQNYGYHYLGGYIEPGVGLQLALTGVSEHDCCASCFLEGEGCFVYEYYNGVCRLVTETSGGKTPTDYCPYGVFGISNPGPGSFYGFGPCAHM